MNPTNNEERLLNDEEIIYQLQQFQIQAAAEHRSFEWAQDKLLDLINTQKRLYAESELSKLVNTTNYDDVPYFVGITAEIIDQRIIALNTKHDWKDNDTWSVFKCKNCGITVFAPNQLPECGGR